MSAWTIILLVVLVVMVAPVWLFLLFRLLSGAVFRSWREVFRDSKNHKEKSE